MKKTKCKTRKNKTLTKRLRCRLIKKISMNDGPKGA